MHTTLSRKAAAIVLLALGFGALPVTTKGADRRPKAPLFDRLGAHRHPVSTKSPLAQRYFDQDLVLLYGFNHAEAIRSFQAAAEIDPQCAMAPWGIAYAYGPNINQPMEPPAVPLAWEALQKAISLKAQATPREQAYIDALAKRYSAEPVEDRAPLDLAYANAMREVMRQYPDDLDAATLFSEAVMDTTPWNYWELDRRPKPVIVEVLASLRRVLRREPDHPGANHFFIHAVEAGPTPEDGLPSADRLRALKLDPAHLLHMPSHIYLRTGLYGDAIDANLLASKVDRQYVARCRAQGFYPAVYYPHNLHFLWFANLMAGCADEALKVANRIAELELDVRCGPSALLETPRLRHLELLTLARFGRWEELAKQAKPAPEFPLDLALWHQTQGLGAVATKDAEEAGRHLDEVRRIAATDAMARLDSPIFPATKVLAVAEAVLAGKVALLRGDSRSGLGSLRKAVDLEDAIPYMEPPYWHAPTRDTLGAELLALDQVVDAEAVFRANLDRHPRSAWSLLGVREALERQRRTEQAEAIDWELKRALERADGPLDPAWF